MNGDKVAHALGEVEGTLKALVDSHRNVVETQRDQGVKLAKIEAVLATGFPCKERGEEINKIKWSFVKIALYLIGAGSAGGGIAAVVTKLWGG